MGACQSKSTQFDSIRKAEAEMKRAVAAFRDGDEPRAKLKLGTAVQHLDDAVALCPSYPMGYYIRAKAHLLLGQYREGARDCDTCHGLMPDLWGAYFLHAECLEAIDEPEMALNILTKVPKKIRESRASRNSQRDVTSEATVASAGVEEFAEQVWPVALNHPDGATPPKRLRVLHCDLDESNCQEVVSVPLGPVRTAQASQIAQWLPVDRPQEPEDRFVEARKRFIENMKRERNFKNYREHTRHMYVKTAVEKREIELRLEQKHKYSMLLQEATIQKGKGYRGVQH